MIRVVEVRVVGQKLETGIYSRADAIKIAKEQDLDLVDISPGAKPPVCKIIDYNKYLYEEKKKKKGMKAKSKTSEVKESRFTPNTYAQDYEYKFKHVEKFICYGDQDNAHVPSNESSPMITYLSKRSIFTCSVAPKIPMAIGRSNALPDFLISAGERLTTILIL